MLRRFIIFWLIISTMIFLQSTYLNVIAFNQVKPDIALIILVFFSIYGDRRQVLFLGLTTGLLQDFISLAPLGFNGIIYLTISFIVNIISRNVSSESILFQWLAIAMVTFLKYLFSILLVAVFSINQSINHFNSSVFLVELVYNLLINPLIFFLGNWIINRMGRR
jgi:rod shape-determining protein MreD